VLPGWALSLFAGSLLLPVLVAVVDAFARARRRHLDVLKWLRWVGAWVAPFLAGLAIAELLALAGATPAPPPAPVPPDVLPVDGPALGVMAGVAVAMALALAAGRWLAARPDPELAKPVDQGASAALGLVIGGGTLLLWLVNPYAGLLAVPAAHLWMLTVLARPMPPPRLRAVFVAVGLAPVLLVAVYYMFALSLNPLEAAWYLLMLVTGHSVGLVTSLIACVLLAAACATAEIAWRASREDDEVTRPAPALTWPDVRV
jgi:hypothetical protein